GWPDAPPGGPRRLVLRPSAALAPSPGRRASRCKEQARRTANLPPTCRLVLHSICRSSHDARQWLQSFPAARSLQLTSSAIGSPPRSTIGIGRPSGERFSFVWLMPRLAQIVAYRSATDTGRSATVSPPLSVLPTTCPPLIRAPPNTTLQA